MTSGRWGALASAAGETDGVFSVETAKGLGIDARRLNRASAAGSIVQMHPRVYRFAASPPTPRGAIRAATLQVPDSRATHESALLLHDAPQVPLVAAVSIGAGRSNQHQNIRVHRVGDLVDEHLRTIQSIPTTSLERAIVDVSAVFGTARLAALIDHLTITRRATSVGAISRALRQVNRRGRLHIARLEQLLDERRPGEPAPRSTLELRMDELLAPSSLPPATKEHPLPSDEGFRGYVDRAWVHAMLILEIDGRTWHARERAMANDRTRDRRAATRGWLTMRVLDDEVRDCPERVISELEAIHAVRSQQLRRSA